MYIIEDLTLLAGKGKAINFFVDDKEGLLWCLTDKGNIQWTDLNETIYQCYTQFDKMYRTFNPQFDNMTMNNIEQKISYYNIDSNMNLLSYCLCLNFLLYPNPCFIENDSLMNKPKEDTHDIEIEINNIKKILLLKKKEILNNYKFT